jgi:hypothetical protein
MALADSAWVVIGWSSFVVCFGSSGVEVSGGLDRQFLGLSGGRVLQTKFGQQQALPATALSLSSDIQLRLSR